MGIVRKAAKYKVSAYHTSVAYHTGLNHAAEIQALAAKVGEVRSLEDDILNQLDALVPEDAETKDKT